MFSRQELEQPRNLPLAESARCFEDPVLREELRPVVRTLEGPFAEAFECGICGRVSGNVKADDSADEVVAELRCGIREIVADLVEGLADTIYSRVLEVDPLLEQVGCVSAEVADIKAVPERVGLGVEFGAAGDGGEEEETDDGKGEVHFPSKQGNKKSSETVVI